jgi:hypothetical protein
MSRVVGEDLRPVAEPQETASRSAPRRAYLIELVAGVIAFIELAVCARLGVVNLDEGWYITAARLVASGHLPYQGFAFTQMPLALYALVPSQLIAPGIAAARATNVLLSTATVVLAVRTTRRIAGVGAAIATAVLMCGAFPDLLYWLTITKTYAVTALCMMVACTALVAERSPRTTTIAVVAAVGATLARLSALPFTLVVIVFALREARTPSERRRIALVSALVALPAAFLLLRDPTAARWDLFSYHQLAAPHGLNILSDLARLPDYISAWPGYSLVVAAALFVLARDHAPRSSTARALIVVLVAGGGFLVANTLGGAFYANEYAVPAIPVLLVAAVSLVAMAPMRRRVRTRTTALAVALAVVVGLSAVSWDMIGAPGWRGAPSATDAITRCVASHSRPGDRVLAFVLAEVVPSARRTPVDGEALGEFSYENVGAGTARSVHVLNRSGVITALQHRVPAVLALTNGDEQILSGRGYFDPRPESLDAVDAAIATGYHRVCNSNVIRQSPNLHLTVAVYARNDR